MTVITEGEKIMYLLKKYSGFTLIELIVVVMIIAIFTAIAIPSYQSYMRRAALHQAQQEMQRLAILLDLHKARNFTYRGFDIASENIPLHATEENLKYTLLIRDGDDPNLVLSDDQASGQHWAIQAQSKDIHNETLLLTSFGVRCKNKIAANVDFVSCGTTGQKEW